MSALARSCRPDLRFRRSDNRVAAVRERIPGLGVEMREREGRAVEKKGVPQEM